MSDNRSVADVSGQGARYRRRAGLFVRMTRSVMDALRATIASVTDPAIRPSASSVLHEMVEASSRRHAAEEAGAAATVRTPRQAKEGDALREVEGRIRAIFDHAGVGILIVEPNGLIADANPAASTLLGLPLLALLRIGALELVHEDDRRAFRDQLDLVGRGDSVHGRGDFACLHADGRARHMHAIFSPVQSAADDVAYVAVMLDDRTEERRMAEQLRHSQKMEAIGRLAGGIAHDFNNLLTAIQGHAQLAIDDLQNRELPCDDLEEVLRSAGRAASLTRQLLAFSRKQPLSPRLLDANAIVSDMERMLRRLIGAEIRLETRLAPDLAPVLVDPVQLEQIVLNLAVNARDAMPEGGRIEVETTEVELSDVEIQGLALPVERGRYIRLIVRDNGSGIEADNLVRIFEPFYTTKELGRGTGLGLSTVYALVEQAGGSLRVESSVGAGTTFSIYFPRAVGEVGADASPVRSGPRIVSENALILVVDDEDGVRTLLRRALERSGYRVIAAASGADALATLSGLDRAPDLLLTDLAMPGMGGEEVAERVRGRCPGIPVLFMSGYSEDEVLSRLRASPGFGFIQKPFSPAGVLEHIGEALARLREDEAVA
ncbi:MAG: ATP-binding protein [Longimicrobiales bacterium]